MFFEQNGIRYQRGNALPFGASITSDGAVNFSVSSRDAAKAALLLFHQSADQPFAKITFPEEFRIGNNYSMKVYGLDIDEIEYGYCFEGPYRPEQGLLFREDQPLLDPYAKLISGREIWGKKTVNHENFPYRGKVLREEFDWGDDKPLELPMEDLVIYEMHVRGFTAHPSGKVKKRATYSGIIEKIPHLKRLGVNCVELLPIFEFDEFENYRKDGQISNYWGYSTVGFFSPKSGYASEGEKGKAPDELKNLVKVLHENGIEILLDVVFNHTAEGNEKGPVISYKGIDNKTYYLLSNEGKYLNYSGCGNTMNCNGAIVRNHILDCLRYWVSAYHIDGFRFDLASILSRDSKGNPMAEPPLLEELAHDSVLGKTKLIAEAWDAGGLYQVGKFPHWGRWAEWNGKYRDCIRRFVKSDASAGPELILRLEGSPDLYEHRHADASINFVTCHDGFTLMDLVSYDKKHNEKNGEQNRDGSNENHSWNCGVEGETDQRDIIKLRKRQMKNICTLLMMSRGVPMILSGDEFGNTQYGNNNAYCQDNEIAWLNWKDVEKNADILEHFSKMISLRNEHPVLRKTSFSRTHNSSGYPELSFHGTKAWQIDEKREFLSFAMMYAEPASEYHTKHDTFIYCAVNAYWEEQEYELPLLPQGCQWHLYLTSDERKPVPDQNRVSITGRSSLILLGY